MARRLVALVFLALVSCSGSGGGSGDADSPDVRDDAGGDAAFEDVLDAIEETGLDMGQADGGADAATDSEPQEPIDEAADEGDEQDHAVLPDIPDYPDIPDIPDIPDTSDIEVTPDIPDTPEIKDTLDIVDTPDVPDIPDLIAPDTPEADIPQNPCPRLPPPPDRPRKVVISHPYDASGKKAGTFDLLDLAEDGALALTGAKFMMGPTFSGEVAFTPDAEIGIVAQDDGTLGVFEIGEDGLPSVIQAAFEGSFYAARVVMDPGGERAWVLDSQWVENGGGIYSVKIGCDGALTDEGMVVPAKLAYAMALLPDGSGRAAVFAKTMLDSPVGKDTHLLAWGLAPKLLAGAAAFPDDDAIVSSMAVTPDSKVILIADNNEFSENSNRVAVLGLSGDTLSPKTVLTGVNDPVALVASPFGNAAIAVSGYGNSIIRLSIAPGAEPPAKVEGPLTWSGKKPQLPGAAVMVAVGKLSGLVLVAENMGVRRVRFEPDGQVTDLGMTAVGDGKGLDEIVGAIGVQP